MVNTYHIFYLISPSFEEEIPDYRTLLGSTNLLQFSSQ